MNRRALIMGGAAILVSAPAAQSRGMYCTRHPEACRQRRAYDQALWKKQAEQEAYRRSLLTPEQRAIEDVQIRDEMARDQARREAIKNEREAEERFESNMVIAGFCALGAVMAGVLGLLVYDITKDGI